MNENIKEYEGLKLGQEILTKRIPDDKLGFGEIRTFHVKDDPIESCISFACQMCGQFRLAYIKDIITSPTVAQKRKVDNALQRLYRPQRRKKKR
tara:strand:- start:856 stop:1137 length:282 start_codon:yes stop_codon:yes gene_type:complete